MKNYQLIYGSLKQNNPKHDLAGLNKTAQAACNNPNLNKNLIRYFEEMF
jgi:hypothetical protein